MSPGNLLVINWLAGIAFCAFWGWMGWLAWTAEPIDKAATQALIERQGYQFRGWAGAKPPCGTAVVVDAIGKAGVLTYCQKDGGYELRWREDPG